MPLLPDYYKFQSVDSTFLNLNILQQYEIKSILSMRQIQSVSLHVSLRTG